MLDPSIKQRLLDQVSALLLSPDAPRGHRVAAVRGVPALQAPAVPQGPHLAYWDSGKARTLVNARGMELGNHWGPVDALTELPDEQLQVCRCRTAALGVLCPLRG